jgi:hypothetical protein
MGNVKVHLLSRLVHTPYSVPNCVAYLMGDLWPFGSLCGLSKENKDHGPNEQNGNGDSLNESHIGGS